MYRTYIQRIVDTRSHPTTESTNGKGLPVLQFVRPLPFHDALFDGVVCRKVDRLIAPLSEHGRDDTLVQRPQTFFTSNRNGRLNDIGIFASLHLSGILQTVVLSHHPDFANFTGCNDQYRFGQSRPQSSRKGNDSRRDGTVRSSESTQPFAVLFK